MKRYNLQLVEQDSKKVVLEIEVIYTINGDGVCFVDNLPNATIVELEEAIAGDQ